MKKNKFVITDKNVDECSKKIANWIVNKVKDAKADGVVLGMSGGIDCCTVAKLCQNKIKIHLILMPYGDVRDTIAYKNAMELINKFNFEYHIYDIKPAVDELTIPKEQSSSKLELVRANIKPRVRMTYLYEYAGLNNLLVIGTGNLSERTIGYFTKWGDGACDINPLGNITKREVYILAKYLQIPDSIINAKPSADLWEGQTDEDEIGISYEQIDNYILNGTSGNNDIDKKIQERVRGNIHKIAPIPIFYTEF